ncbi:MAG: NACHT domain-containing protein [Cyanobacteria bacterium P01_F01_bin.53]
MTAEHQNEGPSQESGSDRNLNIAGGADNNTIIQGDRNTIQHINVFSPITVGAATTAPSPPISKQEYRWRQVLVDNVKHYWIDGVLRKSLHNQALIELGLEERINAVASPLRGVGEFPDEPSRPLPEGTQATTIFDDLGAGRTLLILGDPGAGKTTTLLKLVQSLLERIGDALSQPIPVILNLSSWAKKRQPISDWLVQDLYETFQVSKALGKAWIADEQLILCLDGLDEVAEKHRNACVAALNQFIQSHGRTELVVCSRVKDYEALAEQLRLRSAIYVQPLTPEQVDHYLEQAGHSLTQLKSVLNNNAEIKTFASSPLILSVMSLVYQGCSLEQVPPLRDAAEFRKQLFGAYVQRMFQRRESSSYQYSKEQTRHWLIWLAQLMVQTSQTVFLIERLQPSLLQARAQRFRYRLESALIVGPIVGLIYVLINVLSNVLSNVVNGLINGVSVEQSVEMIIGIIFGLIYGVSVGLSVGLITAIQGNIQPVETLQWSWKATKKSILPGLIYGLIVGLPLGLIIGLLNGLLAGLLGGLFGGLLAGLLGGLLGGLRGPGMQKRTKPNQGIWKSTRNSLIFGLIYGLLLGLLGGLIFGLIYGLIDGLIRGLSFGLIGWLIGWLIGGCLASLRHFSLRLMLYRLGYSPWNYARFLDYATERLFLQKVGGGYIFIHRMLLEHFAQMELAPKSSK